MRHFFITRFHITALCYLFLFVGFIVPTQYCTASDEESSIRFHAFAAAGVAVPLKTTGDNLAPNFLIGAGVGFVPEAWVSVRYMTSTFTDNQEKSLYNSTQKDFDITISSFSLDLRFYMMPSSTWCPYLVIAPGSATIKSFSYFGDPITETKTIATFGAGMDFAVKSSAHVFAEAEFATANSAVYNFAPIRVGFRFIP